MKLFEIKKTAPTWLVMESADGKNVHLEHIEDEIFNKGYLGAQQALNYLNNIRAMFAQGEGTPTKITVKWDGAPAVICGTDPADGKFFVGTKSVFAKNEPKLCKTSKDIRNFYGEQEGLATKLELCLKYLPKLGIGGVLQGDLMFTPGDVTTEAIDGEEYLIFTPNTITYAVPTNSALAKKIAGAKLGIVFHTAYEGPSLPEMRASFGASVAGLNPSKNVWFDDATYKDFTGVASLTPEEDNDIKAVLAAAGQTLRKVNPQKFDIILTNKEFSSYIKPFINNMVRAGEQVGNPIAFLQSFITFYKGKMEAEIAKLKGGPESTAAQARIKKIQDNEQFIEDNSNTLLGILAIYKRIIEAKIMLLQKMQKIESVNTFIKTDNGYRVTAPEGFVAIGHTGAVKLVDRIEFSRQNFSATKAWKKD